MLFKYHQDKEETRVYFKVILSPPLSDLHKNQLPWSLPGFTISYKKIAFLWSTRLFSKEEKKSSLITLKLIWQLIYHMYFKLHSYCNLVFAVFSLQQLNNAALNKGWI